MCQDRQAGICLSEPIAAFFSQPSAEFSIDPLTQPSFASLVRNYVIWVQFLCRLPRPEAEANRRKSGHQKRQRTILRTSVILKFRMKHQKASRPCLSRTMGNTIAMSCWQMLWEMDGQSKASCMYAESSILGEDKWHPIRLADKLTWSGWSLLPRKNLKWFLLGWMRVGPPQFKESISLIRRMHVLMMRNVHIGSTALAVLFRIGWQGRFRRCHCPANGRWIWCRWH